MQASPEELGCSKFLTNIRPSTSSIPTFIIIEKARIPSKSHSKGWVPSDLIGIFAYTSLPTEKKEEKGSAAFEFR